MVTVMVAAPLLDVVGEPAKSFAVALPLQHAAHEHLQWSRVQLLHGNGALGGGVSNVEEALEHTQSKIKAEIVAMLADLSCCLSV